MQLPGLLNPLLIEKIGDTFTLKNVKAKPVTAMWFHLSGITFAVACLASVYLPSTPFVWLLIPVWLVPLASFVQASVGWWYFAIHNPSMLRSEEYQFRERMLESTILHYRDNNLTSPFPVAELLGTDPGSNSESQDT